MRNFFKTASSDSSAWGSISCLMRLKVLTKERGKTPGFSVAFWDLLLLIISSSSILPAAKKERFLEVLFLAV